MQIYLCMEKNWLLWNSILQLLWCVYVVSCGQPCLPLHSPNLVTYVLKRRFFLNAGHEWRIFTYQLDWWRFCISGFGVTKITYRGSNAHTTWLSIIMVNFGLQHAKHNTGTVEKQNFCFGYGPPPAWWWMAPVSFGTKVPQKKGHHLKIRFDHNSLAMADSSHRARSQLDYSVTFSSSKPKTKLK